MSYDYLFKIIFVGDSCVGKTALAERITKNEFHEHYNSTIGVDFSTVTVDIGDQTIKSYRYRFHRGASRTRTISAISR